MTEFNENLVPNGNEINLKHFIYLDRQRLSSYSSQLSDGIVQLRRLTENIGNRSVDTPLEQYEEETTEKGNETEISVGPKAHAGGVSVKNTAKNNKRRGFKTGGTTMTDESSQSFGEDKIDHDNAYLLLEERLIQDNLLREISKINQLEQYSPLIKIRGTARFFDWQSFKDLIINISDILPFLDDNIRKTFEGKQGNQKSKAFQRILNTFSVGTLTVQTHIEKKGVIASLNPDYLCMTREQLRATYVMPGDVEITIVGFYPKRISLNHSLTGIAGTMDLLPLWEGLVGKVDFVLDPIAIYAETRQF